jgi:hypothetical protein
MTVVALTGVVAVGVVVVVAGPIMSGSLASSAPVSVQGVVPTVFGTESSDAVAATADPTAAVWGLGDDSSVSFRIVDADDSDLVSSDSTSVNGSLSMSDGVLTQAEFMVDLSGSAIRSAHADDALVRALTAAAAGNSTASFVLTRPATVGDGDGEHATSIVGTLTVSGRSIAVATTAQVTIDGDTATLIASIPMTLDQYGVQGAGDASAYFDVHLTLADQR